MKTYPNNPKAKAMYDYLFMNKELELNTKFYYFWIIDINEEKDINKIHNFLEEMLIDVVFLEYDNKYIMFYFQEMGFEVENMISTIVDDFGFKFRIYASSKMSVKKRNNFFQIYNLYHKYLKNKSGFYLTNVDLVSEMIGLDVEDIKTIKPIILNNIIDDPQIESLIIGMFQSNLNVAKTANVIYMHRNTVIKKLEYIKKETGLNIQKFIDANIMYWLLKTK